MSLQENENIILKSISFSLNTQIKYLTLAMTLGKCKRNPSLMEEKPIVILLGIEKFFVLLQDFKEIKFEFEYNAITKIYLHGNNPNAFMVCLDKDKIKWHKKYEAFHVYVKNRSNFIKSLICYHSIYNMKTYGEVLELLIKEKQFFLQLKEGSLLSKGLEMIHNNPDGFKKESRKGAEFFIKEYDPDREDAYYIQTAKGDKKFTVKVTVDIGELLSLERFYFNKDEKDVHFFALNNFLNYIQRYEKNTNLSITKSEYYNKKFNLNIDKARWEGFKIEARCAQVNNDLEKKIEGVNENLVFLYLRRKFIPPFYDSYTDILILLREPYDSQNCYLSYDAEFIIETIADSLYFPLKTMGANDYENVLEAKLEALLLDADSLDFFYNNLHIYGKECFKCALDYLYFLVFTIDRYNKEGISQVKELLIERIKAVNTSIDPTFNFSEYDKTLKNNDIDHIIKEFEMKVNSVGTNDYYNQVKGLWEDKMWRYLTFCVDGGLTNDRLNLDEIIKIYKKFINSGGSITYLLTIQLNNMLNIRITNFKDQPLDGKLQTIINQSGEIKTLHYNESVMNILVKSGILKAIQGIENDSNYANFIKYMLDNNPSLGFLKSLEHFLREISIDFESSSDEQALRKSFNTILSSLMSVYSNSKLCPLSLVHACKCLTILTCADIDKNNKLKILQDNVIEVVMEYLNYNDEKLVFCSLKLLLNILPELRENIGDILYKNSRLIPNLIKVLGGTGVPKAFHSLRSIQSVIIVLMNLLKMQPTLVKEILCEEKNRIFIGHLIKYILGTDQIGDKTLSLLLPLQKFIFEFLIDIIKKNSEIKNYMQTTYDFLNIIQEISKQNINFLEDLVRDPHKTQLIYGDLIDPMLKKLENMLKFSFYFIWNDKARINIILSTDDRNNFFKDFVFLAYENKTKELVLKLSVPVCSLFNELNSVIDDEEI